MHPQKNLDANSVLSVTPQDVLGSFLCEVVSGGGFDRRYMANFKKEAARALGRPIDDCMTTNLCDPNLSDAQIRCLDDAFPSGGFLIWYLQKYGNRSLA